MAEHNSLIPLVVVAGPTATGKSEVAIQLAQKLDGEIVCADSMQIYRDLDIGTAKPTPRQMQAVPHHLYSFLDPAARYSVAQYIQDAAAVVADIHAREKMPILCGGTGLYISTFINGTTFLEETGDLQLRETVSGEFDQKGAQALIDEIAAAEPEFAQSLHPNNKKRIVRAVSLLRATGYTIPQQNEMTRPQKRLYQANLAVLHDTDRQRLYGRIERRVDEMMTQGLLDEAAFVHENRDRFITAAQAIGYKEFFGYFARTESLDACVDRLKQATRNYAKRQITWFKREAGAVWYDIEDNPPGVTAGKIYTDIKKEKKQG